MTKKTDRSRSGKSAAFRRLRVLRTGDRDLVFTGVEIGQGRWDLSVSTYYESHIYQTQGGKFVAARWHRHYDVITYTAAVCDAPASVAQQYYIEPSVNQSTTRKGPKVDPLPSVLCEDGKLALEEAAKEVPAFFELFLEEID